MRNFRTYDLAVEFYRLAITLPLSRPLSEQLARAAASIPLNLAEGRGRRTKADQVRFFYMALGSVRECEAILELGNQLSTPAFKVLDLVGACLFRLIERARG